MKLQSRTRIFIIWHLSTKFWWDTYALDFLDISGEVYSIRWKHLCSTNVHILVMIIFHFMFFYAHLLFTWWALPGQNVFFLDFSIDLILKVESSTKPSWTEFGTYLRSNNTSRIMNITQIIPSKIIYTEMSSTGLYFMKTLKIKPVKIRSPDM